ncbi:MAG: hypothetical protein ACQEXJ_02565 [Myxococcota bacterium]
MLVVALLVLVGGGGLALWLAYRGEVDETPPRSPAEEVPASLPVQPPGAPDVRVAPPGALPEGTGRGVFGEPLFPGATLSARSPDGAVYTTGAPLSDVVGFYEERFEGREHVRAFRDRQGGAPTLSLRLGGADSRVDVITLMAAPEAAEARTLIAVTVRRDAPGR